MFILSCMSIQETRVHTYMIFLKSRNPEYARLMSSLFQILIFFLSVLYRRDNRRPFTRANHWLIKDIKAKELISEMDKGRKAAAILIQKMPHIIPHSDRVRKLLIIYLFISFLLQI